MAELSIEQKRALAIASARLRMQQQPSQFSDVQSGSSTVQHPETGVAAGVKSGLSNLNPLNWINPTTNKSPIPGKTNAQVQELAAAAMAGDESAKAELEREFGAQRQAALSQTPQQTARGVTESLIPSSGAAFHFADRVKTDPSGAVAEAATTLGVPFLLGTGVQAGRRRIGNAPERLYQSALKPSTTLDAKKLQQIMDSGLKEGIRVSPAGMDKLKRLISGLNTQVEQHIATKGAGLAIDPLEITKYLDDEIAKAKIQALPAADIRILERAKTEFLKEHSHIESKQTGTQQVPTGLYDADDKPSMRTVPVMEDVRVIDPIAAALAQDIKQGTYQKLGDPAYKLKAHSAQITSQKAIARGMKDKLAQGIPEIDPINQREGGAIALRKQMARALNRIENKDMVGIGTPIAAGAGAAATGSAGAGAAIGITRALLDNPAIKSQLAIWLARMRLP